MTIHRLKWELLAPNDVDRIAQHTREGEGSNEGKDRGPGPSRPSNMLVHIYMVQYIYHSASSRKQVQINSVRIRNSFRGIMEIDR